MPPGMRRRLRANSSADFVRSMTFPRASEGAALFLMPRGGGFQVAAASYTLGGRRCSVIGELLQVTLPERNAMLECVEHWQQKARVKMDTSEPERMQSLLDASPQAKVPFTLRSLR